MDHPLLALPVFAVILLVCVSFGRRVLRLLRVETGCPLESAVFGMAVGFGCLAYLVLLAGLLRLLYPALLSGIIVAMAAVSLREIRTTILDLTAGLREHAGARLKASDSAITLSAVGLGALGLLCALAPPSGLDWDGMAYHLAIPKLYLKHHSIYYVFFTSHSNFPFLTEMLYTVGLALGSTGVAKLFHFSMYLGTAAGIYSLCLRHLDRATGKVAALLFLSIPVALFEAGIAYADLATALYVVMVLYAVMSWEQTGSSPWLVLGGLMGGFALSTKVLAGVPIATLCVWVLFSRRRDSLRSGLVSALTLGMIALVIGCPWYVKSFVQTGNPFYPFLYSLFPHTRNWSQSAADAYRGSQLVFGMGRGVGQALLLPWNLAFDGYKFYDNPNSASPWGLIGPAFLGLVPVYAMARNLNKTVLKIGAIALVSTAAWFVLMQHSRYLLGVLPLFSIVAGAGVSSACRSWRVGRFAAVGLVALTVATSMVIGILLALVCARSAIGVESRDHYLTRTLDIYPAAKYVNETLPSDARIVLFDEVRGFYLDRDYMWGNPGHHEMTPWSRLKTGGDMVRFYQGEGYTHALINGRMPHGDDLLHVRLIPEAIGRELMRDIWSENGVTVYEFVR